MNNPPHLGPLFKAVSTAIDCRITQRVRQSGLTSAQMFVLHYLSYRESGEVLQKDIEEKFGLSHATVAGIISRLEAKGFVALVPDEKDRRCKRISMTVKAKSCDENMRRVIEEEEKSALAGFSEEETAIFLSFLTRIMHNLGVEPSGTIFKEDGK